MHPFNNNKEKDNVDPRLITSSLTTFNSTKAQKIAYLKVCKNNPEKTWNLGVKYFVRKLKKSSFTSIDSQIMAEIRSIVGLVLAKCLKAYDPDREGKFNTYYYAAIENAVNDFKRVNSNQRLLFVPIDDVPEHVLPFDDVDFLPSASKSKGRRKEYLADNSNGFDFQLGVKPSNFIDYVAEKYQMSKAGVVRGILNFWLLKVHVGKSITELQNDYYKGVHQDFLSHMVSSVAGEFDIPEFKVTKCVGQGPFEKIKFDSDLAVQNYLDQIIQKGRSYNTGKGRRYKIYAPSGLKAYIRQLCSENDTPQCDFFAGIIEEFVETLIAIKNEYGLVASDAFIKRLGEFHDVTDKVMTENLPQRPLLLACPLLNEVLSVEVEDPFKVGVA